MTPRLLFGLVLGALAVWGAILVLFGWTVALGTLLVNAGLALLIRAAAELPGVTEVEPCPRCGYDGQQERAA